MYPDQIIITFQDNFGGSKDDIVDGTYVAAALAGSVVSPNVDVATPWTGRRLVGFTQLARTLDAVQQNQVAVNGVIVMEDKPPFLRVRHGLTTDMTNILTKTPTVILIADEVQRQARSVLEQFVGIKFLSGVLSQIEGRMAMMLKNLVKPKSSVLTRASKRTSPPMTQQWLKLKPGTAQSSRFCTWSSRSTFAVVCSPSVRRHPRFLMKSLVGNTCSGKTFEA